MMRVTWRQHRLQVAGALLLLVVLAVGLLITHTGIAAFGRDSGLASCVALDANCSDLTQAFRDRYANLLGEVPYLNLIPVLVGLFWGAPLLAREIEQGTHLLAWTQSVARWRWLAVKVTTFCVLAALGGLALGSVLSWWMAPFHSWQGLTRLNAGYFGLEGAAPIGHALFAFALGTAAGAVFGRTLPAMVTTLGGYIAVWLIVDSQRQNFLPLKVATYSTNTPHLPVARGDWITHSAGSGYIEPTTGRLLSNHDLQALCAGSGGKDSLNGCLAQHGILQRDYFHPASRFWTFQTIELGIYLGLAAVILVFGLWWAGRRAR